MKLLIEKLKAGVDLNTFDVATAVSRLLSETTEDSMKADFLNALHRKGETVEEIVAFVRQFLDRAIDPLIDPSNVSGPLIDVGGTGGNAIDLYDVSTTIMFVLAAGGAVVVNHGDYSVTSRCGSAEVLEALGTRVDLPPERLKECVQRLGIGFISTRRYHPAYHLTGEIRKRFERDKSRTIFSLIDPLLNPARPKRQLIGVFSPRLTNAFADILRRLGRERAWVVHGTAETGEVMNNISTSGATVLMELLYGKMVSGLIDSRWLKIPAGALEELEGGDSRENAAHIEGILSGEIQGAKRDLALVNAAGGFVVAGLAHDMTEGIALAREQIDSGRALERLRGLQQFHAES